jgi:hypothetical protein
MGPRQTSERALVTAGLMVAKSFRCQDGGMQMVLRMVHLKTRTSTSPASSFSHDKPSLSGVAYAR